jgi:hypothetical protein
VAWHHHLFLGFGPHSLAPDTSSASPEDSYASMARKGDGIEEVDSSCIFTAKKVACGCCGEGNETDEQIRSDRLDPTVHCTETIVRYLLTHTLLFFICILVLV